MTKILQVAEANSRRSVSLRVDMRLQKLLTRMEMPQHQGLSAMGSSMVYQMQTLETRVRQVLEGKHYSEYGFKTLRDSSSGLDSRISTGISSGTNSGSTAANPAVKADLKHTFTTTEVTRPLRPPPFGDVQLDLALNQRWNTSCRCSCHIEYYMKSPRFLNRVLGSLFIGYCAIPRLLTGSCDNTGCANHSTATVKLNYRFPYWALWRVISVTLAYNQG